MNKKIDLTDSWVLSSFDPWKIIFYWINNESLEKTTADEFRIIIWSLNSAQSIIIDYFIPDWDEQNIQWDNHSLEIELSDKNKKIIAPIFPYLGIVFEYQKKNNPFIKSEWLELLQLSEEDTSKYTLRIAIKRRASTLPFYIEKIEISE